MFGLSHIQLVIGVGLLAVVLTAGAIACVYDRGASAVTTAVESATIKTLDAARISKEKTDEEVQRTPYDDRIDGLR